MPAGTIGPVCSICEEYEAVGSLMNLADYETIRFCAMCGPQLLDTVLESLRGADTTPDPEPADPAEDAAAFAADDQQRIERELAEPYEPTVDLSPDSWPGTENVVRSTHGHRKTGGDSGDAGEQQP